MIKLNDETMWIDVPAARQLLDSAIGEDGKSVNCREPNHNRVRDYARIMLDGNWSIYIGDAILIDERGRMRNGGHRMNAVIEAGATNPNIQVPFVIRRDVPNKVFDFVDFVVPRSISKRSGVDRQHCEVFRSFFMDVDSNDRQTPMPDLNRKMDAALGDYVDDYKIAGKQPRIVGNAYFKKAAIIRAKQNPQDRDDIADLYEAMAKYTKNCRSVDIKSLPPVARAFLRDVFEGTYRKGKSAPSGRVAKKELFAQGMFVFDSNNTSKRGLKAASGDEYIKQCVRESNKLYKEVVK
jgi:hypothetical protein